MKKTYIIPILETVKVKTSGIICASYRSISSTSLDSNADFHLSTNDYSGPTGGRSAAFGGGLYDDTEE